MSGGFLLGTQPAPAVTCVTGGRVMHGCDAQWRQVGETLEHARQGFGGVLLIEAGWGMGKSLLLRQAVQEAADRGFSLAAGAADQLGRLTPFAELLDALNQPFDEPAGQDPADTLRRQLSRLREHLERRAATAPVLVTLDDLQWASPATLLALRILPAELAGFPVAWILARSDLRAGKHAELLFRILAGQGATRTTLPPLGGGATKCMVTDLLGASPDQSLLALATGAAGNPLLLTELVQGLRDEDALQIAGGRAKLISAQLPGRLRDLAQQRLAGLSRPARHLLETAAVQGESFSLEDASDMLGAAPAVLLPVIQEGVAAGLIIGEGGAFSFRHELMGRAIADAMPPPARRALHREFGEILLNRGDTGTAAAMHLLQGAHAADPGALTGLDRAAAETLHCAPQTAAKLAVRALALTSPTDPEVVTRSVTAAEALTAAGQFTRAAGIVHDTLAQPVAPVAEAWLRCALSSIQCAGGRARQASAEASAVLAQPALPSDLRDQAVTAQLQTLAGVGDYRTASRMAVTILASPGEYAEQAVVSALVVRAMTWWDKGLLGQALELLHEAACHGGVSPDARAFQPLLILAAWLVDLRRFDEADDIIRAADAATLQGIPSEAVPSILRARIHLAMGRSGDAASEGEAALATARALGAQSYISVAHGVLGIIALRRGDIESAAQHLASRPVRSPHFSDSFARPATLVAPAQLAEARHGPAAAIGQIRDIGRLLPAHPGVLIGDPVTPPWLVRTALAAGDRVLAAGIARAAGALARDNPGFRAVTAMAAHSRGLLARDPVPLSEAVTQHDDPWARASAAEDLGVVLVRADPGSAVRHMGQALDEYERAGATLDLARVRKRLRKLGVRRRHWAPSANRPVTGWESLTQTERATSELVAQGLNNKQIAERMYVSVHTIAFHLRQIFRKLDIGSRVELARIVLDKAQESQAAQAE